MTKETFQEFKRALTQLYNQDAKIYFDYDEDYINISIKIPLAYPKTETQEISGRFYDP